MIVHNFKEKTFVLYPTRDITDIIMIQTSGLLLNAPGDEFRYGHHHMVVLDNRQIFKGERVYNKNNKLFMLVEDILYNGNVYRCVGDNGTIDVHKYDIQRVVYSTDKTMSFVYFDVDDSYPSPPPGLIVEFVNEYNTKLNLKEDNEKVYSRKEMIDEVINMITLYDHLKIKGIRIPNIREWVEENID